MALRVGVTLLLQTAVHVVMWVGLWWTWDVVGAATAAWISLAWQSVSRDVADALLKHTRFGFLSRRGAVIVTGAGRGLGKAAVVSLIREGYHVIATVRDLKQAAEFKKQVINGERVIVVQMDVGLDESVKAGAEQIKTLLKQASLSLVGLINNAGITVHGPIETVPIKELDEVHNVNIDGAVRCIQAFLPLLRDSPSLSPRLVNISSVVGVSSQSFLGGYSMSKFALEGLNDALRREVASQGVGVVCLEPGFIHSDMAHEFGSGSGLTSAVEPLRAAGLSSVYEAALVEQLEASGYMSEQTAVPASVFGDCCAHVLSVGNADLHTRYVLGSDSFATRITTRFFPDSLLDIMISTYMKHQAQQAKRHTKPQ